MNNQRNITIKIPILNKSLNLSDIKCLECTNPRPDAWLNACLNDNLMDVAPRLVVLPTKKKCYFLDLKVIKNIFELTAEKLVNNKLAHERNLKTTIRKKGIEFLIGFYLANHHWRLLFVDLKKELFFFLDPLGEVKESVRKDYLEKWKRFLSVREIKSKQWKFGEFSHDFQTDNYNCGILCILFMEKLVKGLDYCNFSTKDLNAYRLNLKDLILQNIAS